MEILRSTYLHQMKETYGFVVNSIVGDGNCYYRTLAHYLRGSQNEYRSIRRALCTYIENNYTVLKEFFGKEILDSTKSDVITEGRFTNGLGIMDISCLAFNIDIFVYNYNDITN